MGALTAIVAFVAIGIIRNQRDAAVR